MTTEPEPTTTAIAPSTNQGGIRMWPSPATAARLYDVANIALVASLVVGLVATFLIVLMGNAKERYARAELAELGLQTAQANERAAKANEAAAKANEAAERERVERLKLEARLADRVLPPEGLDTLRSLARSFPKGTKLDINTFGSTIEVSKIAGSIGDALTDGGWVVRLWHASGGSARGICIGSDPSQSATARAAGELVALLTTHGVGASEYPFSSMPQPAVVVGPAEPMDAPIRLYIGTKQ